MCVCLQPRTAALQSMTWTSPPRLEGCASLPSTTWQAPPQCPQGPAPKPWPLPRPCPTSRRAAQTRCCWWQMKNTSCVCTTLTATYVSALLWAPCTADPSTAVESSGQIASAANSSATTPPATRLRLPQIHLLQKRNFLLPCSLFLVDTLLAATISLGRFSPIPSAANSSAKNAPELSPASQLYHFPCSAPPCSHVCITIWQLSSRCNV